MEYWPADNLILFGVVPVFFNAGAALLPVILAAVASAVSLLLRPRDLVRTCRARPGAAAATVLGIVAVCLGIAWLVAPADARAARRMASEQAGDSPFPTGARIDWAAQAVEWLKQEKLASLSRGATSAPAPVASAAGATIFGGSPLRNGYSGGGSPLGLLPAWDFPAPGSPAAEELGAAMFFSSPAVVDGAVYGAACLLDAFGNYGTVFCLDAAAGRPRWTSSGYKDSNGKDCQFKGFFSSPAISADGQHLVIGQGLHNDEHCDLVCISTKTGRLHWHVKTPLHIEGSPAIDGDLAVAGAGAIESGSDHKVQGHAGLVLAVQVSTGRKLWEYQLNDPESSPVMRDGIVYIGSGFNGNAVVALRTETDEALKSKGLDRLVWRSPTPYPATGTITLADDLVLVGCGNGDYVFVDPRPQGSVLALDRRTGKPCWEVKLPDAVLGRIAVRDGKAAVPVRNGEVVMIDLNVGRGSPAPAAGRILWRQRISGEKAILAGPAFTGAYVYAVSQDGRLAVLDAKDGRLVEKHNLNAKGKPGEMGLAVSSPTIAGGRLYVGSETGGLRCFAGQVEP